MRARGATRAVTRWAMGRADGPRGRGSARGRADRPRAGGEGAGGASAADAGAVKMNAPVSGRATLAPKPMAFPSLLSGVVPYGMSRQMQRDVMNAMNLMEDVMMGGPLGALDAFDPFRITMHADHTEGVPTQILNFPIDVIMKKDKYLIHADLPGLSMKDVTVEMEEVQDGKKILHVTAKREHRAEEQDETEAGKWVAYERFYGKMDRSLPLPDDCAISPDDADAIKCQLVNGELTISIKRNPPAETKKANPRKKIPIADH